MSYTRIDLKADIRRKKAAVATTVIFLAVLFGVGIALVLLERPTVSRTENRTLEERPEFSLENYLNGSFAEGLDRYYTDTVPFRDALNECAAVLENAKGIPAPQFYGVEIVNDIAAAEEPEPEPEPFPAGTETEHTIAVTEQAAEAETSVTAAPDVPEATSETETAVTSETESEGEFVGDINDFLNNGILVNGVDMYGEKAGIMLFGGNDKQGERYAGIINYCKEQLGDSVTVYDLVVPTSVEFYLPEKYSRYSNSEKREIEFIYSKLRDDVVTVDAYSVLEAHKDEYIYFRTDHHWTDLGAYYAYTAFCDAIGQTPPGFDNYDIITKEEPFVGSLYGYTNDITLKNNPDTFTYYKTRSEFHGESFKYDTLQSAGVNPIYHEYASGSNMYGMFLGSDSAHVKITTKAGTGRKIVMFKESYGNAFAPYLIDSFDEIYVIDIRYFGRNAIDYIKQVGATDVLFINNVFAANTSTLIGGIERMMTSPTGTIVTTAAPVTETSGVSDTAATSGTPAASEPPQTSLMSETPMVAGTVAPAETSAAAPPDTESVTDGT